MDKMKQNVQYTSDAIRSNHDRLRCHDFSMKTVLTMLKEIKTDIAQFSFHMKMDTVDLSNFFPLKTAEDLKSFMDREHEDWPMRRRAFHHLLYTTVTKNKKKFAAALLHTLFSREFVQQHYWPSQG